MNGRPVRHAPASFPQDGGSSADKLRTSGCIPGSHLWATGAGLKLELSRFDGERWQLLKTVRANAGGRPAEPLLIGDSYRTGRYEVLLHLEEYFSEMAVRLPNPAFLSRVPLRFVIQDAAQCVHLATLFSPWGYSYYRGS